MTKQTKYILIGAAGLIVAGAAALVLIIAAIVGIGVMSAESNAASKTKSTVNSAGKKDANGKDARIKKPAGVFDDEETNDDSSQDAANLSGTLAPELVGIWHRSEGSGHIDYTGKTQYKSGADFTYEFAANGAVKYSMEADVLSIIQCKIKESETAFGAATSDGATLTISLNKTAHTKSNSCESSEDVDETLPAKTVELKYTLKTEYDVTKLCVESDEGEKCYDRKSD